MRRWRSRDTVALVFVTAGVLHFAIPAPYIAIVPPWLPAAPTLVAVSGLAEIAGGIGVLDPRTKRLAGWASSLATPRQKRPLQLNDPKQLSRLDAAVVIVLFSQSAGCSLAADSASRLRLR